MSNNENTLLSQYYTEEEVAEFLNKTINSLRADASRRKGAPRTVIGKVFEKILDFTTIYTLPCSLFHFLALPLFR